MTNAPLINFNAVSGWDFERFQALALDSVKNAWEAGLELVAETSYVGSWNCCAVGAISIKGISPTPRTGQESYLLALVSMRDEFPDVPESFLSWILESLEAGFEHWGHTDVWAKVNIGRLHPEINDFNRRQLLAIGAWHTGAYELGVELRAMGHDHMYKKEVSE